MSDLTEMLKGVLEGCVLELISRGSTYGYEITRQLNELGFADVVEGTVYTVLLRLEKKGFISSEKKRSELGPPRKMYTLSGNGPQKLKQFWDNWDIVSSRIDRLREDKDE